MQWMTLLLAVGATLRLTRLIYADTITFPFRDWLASKNPPGEKTSGAMRSVFRFVEDMVSCPWCLSVWVGCAVAPVAWFFGDTFWFVIPALMLTASQVSGMILAREAS